MAYLQAVVFDLDDTLYPEQQYVFSGFRAAARCFAQRQKRHDGDEKEFYQRACNRFVSGQRVAVFDDLLQEMGIAASPDDVASLVHAYRAHVPQGLELHGDAKAILEALKGRVAVGVLTDGYLVSQRQKIASLGLESHCDVVICTDEFGRNRWKPDPHCFEAMARRLDVLPPAIGYVGDNLAKDFVAPNRLGWATFCIRRANGVHFGSVPPLGGEPQYWLDSLMELTAFVEEGGRSAGSL